MVHCAAAAHAAPIDGQSRRGALLPWPTSPGDAVVSKALLIDPDPEIRSAAALHMLRQNGVAVDQAATAEAALEAIARRAYNLIILELASADYDGADLCRRIVERNGPPVLVWSVRAAPLDQVAGLELGAEDYVAKTAHPLELLARTRAILRRGRAGVAAERAGAQTELAPNAWLFDERVNSIRSWQGQRVWLRPASSSLLSMLCARPREQIGRDELLRAVSRGETAVALRTIDVIVSRLRRSLEACDGGGYLIRTVRPTGYLFDAAVETGEAGVVFRG